MYYMSYLNVSCDWISVTYHSDTAPEPALLGDIDTEIRPIRGYTGGIRYASGICEYISSDERMGTHYTITGQSFVRLQDMFGSFDVLSSVVASGGNLSRLDLAIDIYDSGIDLSTLYDHIISGDAQTRSRTFAMVSNHDKEGISGQGIYVGSRKNRSKLLCVYDKALELDLSRYRAQPTDHKRAELRLYSQYAKKTAPYITDADDPKSYCVGILNGFFKCDAYAAWSDALGSDIHSMPARNLPGGNTEHWLLFTVAKNIAKQLITGGDEFATRMNASIQAYYDDMIK